MSSPGSTFNRKWINLLLILSSQFQNDPDLIEQQLSSASVIESMDRGAVFRA